MTRTLLTGLATAALLQAQPSVAADAPYSCGTGRLVDVELVTDVVSNGTTSVTTTKRNKKGERKEYTHTTPSDHTEKTYFITIELDDMRYVARSSGNLPWHYNPMRMVINDPIGVCVDRKHLMVTRPDGKIYKASIVRASRELPPLSADRDGDREQMRLPSSPITLNKSADAPRPRVERSTLTVPAGRWGTSEPLGRPCYAGMITEPCSTPGPSVRIELPGFRVKK